MTNTPTAIFNPLEEGFVDWPYEQYAALRREDPIHYSDLLMGWVLTRYEDVSRVLREADISSDIENANPTPMVLAERKRRDDSPLGGRTLVLLDDPDHRRLRNLLAAPFRFREIEKLREQIAKRVNGTLDKISQQGPTTTFDLVADFSYPLPVEIFCEMLGIPDEDHPQFRYWTNCVARSLDPLITADERDECEAGIESMYRYLEAQAEEKRSNPTDDLMSSLVLAEEDGVRLTHEELMAQLLTLYVAGHEPTAGLVGNGMLAMLQSGEQWRLLTSQPDLLKHAVNELLRFDGPNQFVRRIALADLDFEHGRINKGDVIYASPASANRDEDQWGPTAANLDITRADSANHLQFGAGIHTCLGVHLAKLQAEIFIGALIERCPVLELAGEHKFSTRMVIRGLASLPVRATFQ